MLRCVVLLICDPLGKNELKRTDSVYFNFLCHTFYFLGDDFSMLMRAYIIKKQDADETQEMRHETEVANTANAVSSFEALVLWFR